MSPVREDHLTCFHIQINLSGKLVELADDRYFYTHEIYLKFEEAQLLLHGFTRGDLEDLPANRFSVSNELTKLLAEGLLRFRYNSFGQPYCSLTKIGRQIWEILDERFIDEH